MTENSKKFLELVSKDKKLAKKLTSANMDELIAMAKEQGIVLTEADFKEQTGELSDDELEAVAGGWTECSCLVGGGGKGDADGKPCGCVGYGEGYGRDGRIRCGCPVAGAGLSGDWMAYG